MYDIEEKENLQKCKYCDGAAKLDKRPHAYWVQCTGCGFSIRYFINPTDAKNAWNEKMK